jgi:hypothetical protein
MPFPENAQQMHEQKYKFLDQGICDGCHEVIEWWRTPNGHQIPMNPMPTPESPAIAHWATCPMVEQFQKKRTANSKQ